MSRSVVLGLGNPGTGYRGTRHNLGSRVVEELARRAGARALDPPARGPVLHLFLAVSGPLEALLATPATYMNESGRAAKWLLQEFGVAPEGMIVVFDDADLPLGRVRIRRGGGSGGHRGIRSILEHLGTGEFRRVKLGVRGAGRDGRDLAEYVLGEFDEDERPRAAALARTGADAVEAVLRLGIEAAMSRFNAAPAGGEGGGEERERGLERTGSAGRPDPE